MPYFKVRATREGLAEPSVVPGLVSGASGIELRSHQAPALPLVLDLKKKKSFKDVSLG